MKVCNVCEGKKSRDEFFKRSSSKDGITGACKPCAMRQNRKWVEKNPRRMADLQQRWAKNNRGRKYAAQRRHIKKMGDLYNERRCLRKAFTGYKPGSKPHILLGAEQPIVLAHLLKTWEDRYGRPLVDGDRNHIDHIKPVSKGGTHYYKNLQLLTPSDNSKKGVS